MAELEARDSIRNFQPPVSGDIIRKAFGIQPCREVGLIKNHIKEAILEGNIPNQFDAAWDEMLLKGQKLGLELRMRKEEITAQQTNPE